MRRLTVLMLCCGAGAAAQTRPFRVETSVVQVPVAITAKNGQHLDGLTASDFRVIDNGKLQAVTVDDFNTGLAQVSLAVLIQTAGVSTPALAKIRRIGGMIQPLVTGERGEAAVITFDSRVVCIQDFTADDAKIRDAIAQIKPGSAMDRARMLDAVAEAAARLDKRKGRKVLLLISETRDRGSETSLRQVVQAVESQGIEVFGASYSAYATGLIAKPKDLPDTSAPPAAIDPIEGPPPPPQIEFLPIIMEVLRLGKTNAVQALTRETGGADFPFTKESGLENAIQKLGVEVHSQYVLSFPQPKDSPGWHEIQVLVPNRPGLLIRARHTYLSEPGNAQQ